METLILGVRHAGVRLYHDPVLLFAAAAAVVSSFFVHPSVKYLNYPDYRVLCLLFALMLVVAGLQSIGVFRTLTDRLLLTVHNTRSLSAVLTGMCFFTSMFITNDVALITFVPFTVLTLTRAGKEKLMIIVITLQTIAANLGSILTPLGNPQNLYLYTLSDMTVIEFTKIMLVPTLVSFIMLTAAIMLIKAEPLESPESIKPTTQDDKITCRCAAPWAILFLICLLSVLRVIPYAVSLAAVVISVFFIRRSLLYKVDYSLLLTFVFFFIFIGNMKNLPAISETLSAAVSGREMSAGILLSQVISNVPTAMLLSGFTTQYQALLLGVDLGGLGTLIASMASVISYKIYASSACAEKSRYLIVFTIVNAVFLAVLWTVTVFTV